MATYTQRKEPKREQDKQHEKSVELLRADADYDGWPECSDCGEPYNPRRAALGYSVCLDCGEDKREFAIVPVPKSNYTIARSIKDVASPYSHKGNR